MVAVVGSGMSIDLFTIDEYALAPWCANRKSIFLGPSTKGVMGSGMSIDLFTIDEYALAPWCANRKSIFLGPSTM